MPSELTCFGRPLVQTRFGSRAIVVAVVDGPYDAFGLRHVLARPPIAIRENACTIPDGVACRHGTFILGLIGARNDLNPPGLCPQCILLHVPLFRETQPFGANVIDLASAIKAAVDNGAKLINLSLAVVTEIGGFSDELGAALNRAYAAGSVVIAAAGAHCRFGVGQLLEHPVTIPVVAFGDYSVSSSNLSPEIVCRAVAVNGTNVRGYGPGGRPAVMSGSSAATAVATGILAAIWSSRPHMTATDVRAAVRLLSSRGDRNPVTLDWNTMIVALNSVSKKWNSQSVGGKSIMSTANVDVGSSVRLATAEESGTEIVRSTGDTRTHSGAASCECLCRSGAVGPPVYVIGTIDVRFPDPALENEIEMLVRDLGLPTGQIEDRAWLFTAISRVEARYIARELCWTVSVESEDGYILRPHDPSDWSMLIDGLQHPRLRIGSFAADAQVVIGTKGPMAHVGNVDLPLLLVDQVALTTLTTPPVAPASKSRAKQATNGPSAGFKKLIRYADNFGDTDSARALNYLIARYKPIHDLIAEQERSGFQLDEIIVLGSRLNGKRRIVDPIVIFRNGRSGVTNKHFMRVDVTHKYPMTIIGIEPYASLQPHFEYA